MTSKCRKGVVQRESVEREEYAKVPISSSGERGSIENLLSGSRAERI